MLWFGNLYFIFGIFSLLVKIFFVSVLIFHKFNFGILFLLNHFLLLLFFILLLSSQTLLFFPLLSILNLFRINYILLKAHNSICLNKIVRIEFIISTSINLPINSLTILKVRSQINKLFNTIQNSPKTNIIQTSLRHIFQSNEEFGVIGVSNTFVNRGYNTSSIRRNHIIFVNKIVPKQSSLSLNLLSSSLYKQISFDIELRSSVIQVFSSIISGTVYYWNKIFRGNRTFFLK